MGVLSWSFALFQLVIRNYGFYAEWDRILERNRISYKMQSLAMNCFQKYGGESLNLKEWTWIGWIKWEIRNQEPVYEDGQWKRPNTRVLEGEPNKSF